MEITLIFCESGRHPLDHVIVKGKRRAPPLNVHTRPQFLEYYAKQGWTLVKSCSYVYTFRRPIP